jgi:phosphate:Na+ symporter
MTLAFVGAGILNLNNAVGIIIGANLGTTVTGWIFAIVGFKLKIKSLNHLLIGVSGLIITLAKSALINLT